MSEWAIVPMQIPPFLQEDSRNIVILTSQLFMSAASLADNCQQVLARNFEYQKTLRRILHKFRNSVSLDAICTTTGQDIVRLLDIERVAFYRFNEDWSGEFVNEYGYAVAPWNQIEAFGKYRVWEDTHLQETQGGRYKTHDPFAVADIYEAGHARCHVEMLEQYQVRAYVVAPIFAGNQL